MVPVPVYAVGTLQAISPTVNARWAAVVAAAIDIALLFIVAEQLFASRSWALLAALLLLCTPAHITYSRLAVHAGIWHLPFMLGWLTTVVYCRDRSRPAVSDWRFALGAALLVASIYTQPFAAALVPVFGAIGLATVARANCLSRRALWIACAATVLVVLPAGVMFARFPETYAGTFGEWTIHSAHLRNPIVWVQDVLNRPSLAISAMVWWDFFSPGHLAVNPSAAGLAGVFLSPVALLVAVGCYAAVKTTDEGRRRLLLGIVAIFLFSPLVVAIYKEPRVLSRGLVSVPSGVLLAVIGIDALWSTRAWLGRPLVVAALGVSAIQFLVWIVRGPFA
jgi:hypothetical protein